MNDYAATSHEAIYAMVKAGRPGQVNGYAAAVNDIRNQLGGHIAGLREQLEQLPSVWSDGAGSERLTTDLGAVSNYLEVLADGLSGQSSSYADLVTQAAADLTAAQPPAVLPPPPPPGLDVGSLQSDKHMSVMAVGMNPAAPPGQLQMVEANYDARIDAAVAAQQLAGQTATTLDNKYRTVLARLTPPPEPPATVTEAAGTSPVAPAVDSGSADDRTGSGGINGGGGLSTGDGVFATGGSGSGSTAGAFPSNATPAGATAAGWSTAPSAAPGAAGAAAAGSTIAGGWLASGAAGPTTGGVGSTDGVLQAGAGGFQASTGAIPPTGLRTDGSVLTGGGWDVSGAAVGSAQAAHLQPGSALFGQPGHAGSQAFDPITGAPVTSAGGQSAAGAAGGGPSWETLAGAGGLAALAGGVLYLARGGVGQAGALGAAGLAGGPAGAGGVGSGGFAGTGMGGAGMGGGAGSPAGVGSGGAGSAAGGSASAANSSAAGGARGMLPGSAGSNSMVQGGQIGQAGRPTPGTAGYGAGRPAAPGSVIGDGQQDHRVTWLVEDRDLYGIGPSVAAVIEVPIEPT